MNNYKLPAVIICCLLLLLASKSAEKRLISKRLVNLQFITNLDGQKILSSVDNITTDSDAVNGSLKLINKSFLSWGKKAPTELPLNKINSTNPQLAALWNSTSMVFGAAADGVGVGTTFAIKKEADGRMVFITNFHVVEQFCNIPQNTISDLAEVDSFKYPCQALFVLHDVAINTKANSAEVDGAHPWKSEVMSLDYFDKQRDLAVFRINLPDDNDIAATAIEMNYDIKSLLIPRNTAEKLDPKLPPITTGGVDVSPMTAFQLYLVAFSMPKADLSSIKKQWFKGTTEGSSTFENNKKLGFISALKHNIEVLPGSSGGPLALSDGRVVGLNTSVEIKQFYVHSGWWFWAKDTLTTYNSFFAMPSTFIKDFFEKIN
jgi:hypothetical protein